MHVARPLVLDSEQLQQLEQCSRARSLPARMVERSRIVLLAAEDKLDIEIAEQLSISAPKAARWRNRFLDAGLEGLKKDAPRPGRTPRITPDLVREVIARTTQTKPANATYWSTGTLAAEVGISDSSVLRIWKANGLKPHLVETFKVSNDPHFADKLEAIVGLYLNPPEHALVLSADEKSQIQAVDRSEPGLPLKRGRGLTMTHDYKRHGTTTLFAALNTRKGEVMGMCMRKHRHQEWLYFLRHIERVTPPAKQIHIICDHYAAHKHAAVRRWISRNPRFHVHFTPTSASWLNMVERFFRNLTANRLKRGVFRDLEELIMAVGDYIDRHKLKPKPFIWTASARDILEKITRARKTLDNPQSV
jgi:transposase